MGTETNPIPLISILFGKEAGLEIRIPSFLIIKLHWSSATSDAPRASKSTARLDLPEPERPIIKIPEPLRSTQVPCIIGDPVSGVFASNLMSNKTRT
jgi:hypothetical protein